MNARQPKLGAVVMAAGLGTRMRSDVPKHLHPLLGRRMVDWVLASARGLGGIRSSWSPRPRRWTTSAGSRSPCRRLRSGRATPFAARSALEGSDRERARAVGRHAASHDRAPRRAGGDSRSRRAWATVLSFEPDDPKQYRRVLRNADGGLAAIVEHPDASAKERAVREVNSSIYVFRADRLWPVLDRLLPHNVQGELYLTDSVALLAPDGGRVAVHKGEILWRQRV